MRRNLTPPVKPKHALLVKALLMLTLAASFISLPTDAQETLPELPPPASDSATPPPDGVPPTDAAPPADAPPADAAPPPDVAPLPAEPQTEAAPPPEAAPPNSS